MKYFGTSYSIIDLSYFQNLYALRILNYETFWYQLFNHRFVLFSKFIRISNIVLIFCLRYLYIKQNENKFRGYKKIQNFKNTKICVKISYICSHFISILQNHL